jgi:hypothetical protein
MQRRAGPLRDYQNGHAPLLGVLAPVNERGSIEDNHDDKDAWYCGLAAPRRIADLVNIRQTRLGDWRHQASRSVLDCGSPLPLSRRSRYLKAAEDCRSPGRFARFWPIIPYSGFTECLPDLEAADYGQTQTPQLLRRSANWKPAKRQTGCRRYAKRQPDGLRVPGSVRKSPPIRSRPGLPQPRCRPPRPHAVYKRCTRDAPEVHKRLAHAHLLCTSGASLVHLLYTACG